MRAMRMTAASGRASCDPSGCIGKLGDGAIVAYAVEPEAFEDDCARAAVILAVHDDPPPGCAAKVIGRDIWYGRGALALRRDRAGFVIEFRAAAESRPAMGAGLACTQRTILRRSDECRAQCSAA